MREGRRHRPAGDWRKVHSPLSRHRCGGFVGRRVPARVVVLIQYAAVPPLAGTAVLSLSNSKSNPFVVSAILNFVGLVQYATICLKMSPDLCCVRLFFQD